jgi:hypothetical protein
MWRKLCGSGSELPPQQFYSVSPLPRSGGGASPWSSHSSSPQESPPASPSASIEGELLDAAACVPMFQPRVPAAEPPAQRHARKGMSVVVFAEDIGFENDYESRNQHQNVSKRPHLPRLPTPCVAGAVNDGADQWDTSSSDSAEMLVEQLSQKAHNVRGRHVSWSSPVSTIVAITPKSEKTKPLAQRACVLARLREASWWHSDIHPESDDICGDGPSDIDVLQDALTILGDDDFAEDGRMEDADDMASDGQRKVDDAEFSEGTEQDDAEVIVECDLDLVGDNEEDSRGGPTLSNKALASLNKENDPNVFNGCMLLHSSRRTTMMHTKLRPVGAPLKPFPRACRSARPCCVHLGGS